PEAARSPAHCRTQAGGRVRPGKDTSGSVPVSRSAAEETRGYKRMEGGSILCPA
ncbi:hypothetical protein THAOC_19605, partial [Thalassiosira oceanica]